MCVFVFIPPYLPTRTPHTGPSSPPSSPPSKSAVRASPPSHPPTLSSRLAASAAAGSWSSSASSSSAAGGRSRAPRAPTSQGRVRSLFVCVCIYIYGGLEQGSGGRERSGVDRLYIYWTMYMKRTTHPQTKKHTASNIFSAVIFGCLFFQLGNGQSSIQVTLVCVCVCFVFLFFCFLRIMDGSGGVRVIWVVFMSIPFWMGV
jgi:hypothetical protein